MASLQPWLSVMQDNAPYAVARMMEEMGERIISPISWPPNSSDLNLTGAVWDIMKDYAQFKYPSLGSERKTTISRYISTGCEGSEGVFAL